MPRMKRELFMKKASQQPNRRSISRKIFFILDYAKRSVDRDEPSRPTWCYNRSNVADVILEVVGDPLHIHIVRYVDHYSMQNVHGISTQQLTTVNGGIATLTDASRIVNAWLRQVTGNFQAFSGTVKFIVPNSTPADDHFLSEINVVSFLNSKNVVFFNFSVWDTNCCGVL